MLCRTVQAAVRFLGQGERQVRPAAALRLLHSCSALVYRQHGPHYDTLRMEKWALPAVGQHCVRLKMLAAPVNPADINMLQGTYPILPPFPAVGGNEGVGEVVEVGSEVTCFSPGDWVIPVDAGFGTWRTEVVCDAADVIKVPSDITLLGAATIGVNPCTAYRMLHDFEHLRPGDTVIQNGGNSAVGQAVIQVAANMGVRTINVIRDRPNRQNLVEELMSMGADYVVTEEALQSSEMEAIFKKVPKPKLGLNCVGGQSGGLLLSHLDDGATLVTYGGMAKKPLLLPAKVLIFRNITLRGFWMTQWKRNTRGDPHRLQSMVSSLCDLVRAGRLSPPRCVPVPFCQYRDALEGTVHAHQRKHVLVM
ncbi:enoyl-[acyl-carrier-protein] reductase, mitochondrial [Megalops cyprinoides]|uniref:enoyl-[acyl-carrier-protein] reductase, mitochondrial n=1 Tax=Megalops cyprinoides TaxID=118141 RepID=UPI001863EB7C|nr:enoyl-[acyl-carrier-protein] reductase, mitochondrial [Megalops cyprinoides]